MASPYSKNVGLRRPPHGAETRSSARVRIYTTVDSDADSTPSVQVFKGLPHAYVLLRWEAFSMPTDPRTVIGYVKFGAENEFESIEPATPNDWPVLHGELWEWQAIAPYDQYFRMVRATSSPLRARFYVTDSQEP